MIKYTIKAFFILLLLTFISCEKETVNVKVPKVEPKIVIQSYISPQDTLLVVHVTHSISIYQKVYLNENNNSNNIRDAIVTLSDGSNIINLEYSLLNNNDSEYTADPDNFPIIAGKTYHILVTTPDGKKASSSCTVPNQSPFIYSFKLDSITRDMSYYISKEYYIIVGILDIPNQKNHYRIAGNVRGSHKSTFQDEVIDVLREIDFKEKEFFTDKGKEGETIIFKNKLNYVAIENLLRPFHIIIELISTDAHYYNYHQSLRNLDNENPFMEPEPIYSNIQGGLGVFSAYNKIENRYTFN